MVYRFEGVGINDDEWMEVVERQIWAGEARARARDHSPGHVGQVVVKAVHQWARVRRAVTFGCYGS
jgi:hypothetical protein